MKKIYLLAVLLLASAGACFCEEAIDENELFSSSGIVTQAAVSLPAPEAKKTLGFSGQFTSVTEDVGISTAARDNLNSYIISNVFLDARLKNDIKAFADVEANYQPRSRVTEYNLREMFFDFNFARRVYFRTGKQVLQWGRCYLWNPTDLINVEKKQFIRKIGYREGAYGLKFHMPFGAERNIYGFLDTGNALSPDDLGGALKYEFLTGRTEMAFSCWAKNNFNTVYGYDFSSRLCDVDILGELAASKGDNTLRMVEENGALYVRRNDEDFAPKASVNLSKGFRLGNFNDRLTVSTEFYYDRLGYNENIFKSGGVYQFASPVSLGNNVFALGGTKRDFLLLNGLYNPNYLSRYYGALFATVSRFIISDMTLNLNYIRNFTDGSGVISTGVTYTNINDFSAGLLLNSAVGDANGEYTFSKIIYDIQFTLGVSF